MDSIEPPSFSLGFDLDAASDLQSEIHQNPSSTSDQLIGDGDNEPELGLTVSDSDRELEPDFTSPVLKRLRRGINPNKCSVKDDRSVAVEDRDDDIEEFSSPEDFPTGNYNFELLLRLFEYGSYLNCWNRNRALLDLLLNVNELISLSFIH